MGDREGREEKGGGEWWRTVFWNVAGLGNKDKEFWKGLAEWNVIVLLETWVEEKGWMKVKRFLPREYVWGIQLAKRKSKKGRAIGGMVIGIRERDGREGKGNKNEGGGYNRRESESGGGQDEE